MNQKPLCYAPFIGMYATSYNGYAPCCISKKFYPSSPEKFWTGKAIQQVRQQLLDQQWPDSCSYCMLKEKDGLVGDNKFWFDEYNLKPVEINIETGNETGKPFFLDYRPSNVCNLKCRMCIPRASNQIEKEVTDNPELLKWFSLKKEDVDNYDTFVEYIDNLDLIKIKIIGGEPTIDPRTLDLLERLKSKTPTPILRFTTNGTNLNDKFRSLMSKFDKIYISFSVDATGKEYEYIRTNANWNKTKRNIEKVFEQDLATQYGFNIVLMPYNIFNITPLLDWFYTLYCMKYKFYLYFDNSDIPHNSLSAVLPEDIDYAIEQIEMWTFANKKIVNVDGFNQLVKILEKVKFNQDDYQSFKKFNNTLDKIRKTNLLDLDPRFKKYI